MTKLSDIYTLYLKAKHLPADGSPRKAIIESAKVQVLHPRPGMEQRCVVLSFKTKKHKLILNQSNANIMFDIGGDDIEAWSGIMVQLRRQQHAKNETIVIEPTKDTPQPPPE